MLSLLLFPILILESSWPLGFLTPDTLQTLRVIKDFPNNLPLSASSYGFEKRSSFGGGSGGERHSILREELGS